MSSPTATHPPEPPSLFDRVGGETALRTVVDAFYDRVLADPALRPYFHGVDTGRLRTHQYRFLAAALGGPGSGVAPDLAAAHHGRGITPAAFDLVAQYLLTTLAEAETTEPDRAEIAAALGSFRPAVVAAEPV